MYMFLQNFTELSAAVQRYHVDREKTRVVNIPILYCNTQYCQYRFQYCQSIAILKRRHMLFGNVARLDATTPAHQMLKQVIAVKSGYQPDAVWRRAPGRPRNSWIMQIGNGSPLSIRREWKKAQDHGHHGESSQRT